MVSSSAHPSRCETGTVHRRSGSRCRWMTDHLGAGRQFTPAVSASLASWRRLGSRDQHLPEPRPPRYPCAQCGCRICRRQTTHGACDAVPRHRRRIGPCERTGRRPRPEPASSQRDHVRPRSRTLQPEKRADARWPGVFRKLEWVTRAVGRVSVQCGGPGAGWPGGWAGSRGILVRGAG